MQNNPFQRARYLPHLDAAEPVAHVGEGELGGDVVHQHHPVRLPEKLLGHAAVPAGMWDGSVGEILEEKVGLQVCKTGNPQVWLLC